MNLSLIWAGLSLAWGAFFQGNQLIAAAPGKVIQVGIEPGMTIDGNCPSILFEAMKMVHQIDLNLVEMRGRKVVQVVQVGDIVEAGQPLLTFEY